MPHVRLRCRPGSRRAHAPLPVWPGSGERLLEGLAGPLLPAPSPPSLLPHSCKTLCAEMLSVLCSMSSVGMGPWGSVQQASVLSN